MDPVMLFMCGAGVLTIILAAGNFDWFMTDQKAQWLVDIAGRNGARIVFVILGIVFIVIGIMEGFSESGTP